MLQPRCNGGIRDLRQVRHRLDFTLFSSFLLLYFRKWDRDTERRDSFPGGDGDVEPLPTQTAITTAASVIIPPPSLTGSRKL